MIIIVGQALERHSIKRCGCKMRLCVTVSATENRVRCVRLGGTFKCHSSLNGGGGFTSRKNCDVKYFSGKITDGKKVARVISFDTKLKSLCSAVSIAVLSRIIFNLSSLCSAVSTSLISLCLCLSNITSLSSSVSIALVSLYIAGSPA